MNRKDKWRCWLWAESMDRLECVLQCSGNTRSLHFPLPIKFFLIQEKNYRNSHITVRENVVQEAEWQFNFWFNIKLSISNGFGSGLRKLATFCRFNALNSNPSRTSDKQRLTKRAVVKSQWNRFRHPQTCHLLRFCRSSSDILGRAPSAICRAPIF